MELRQSEVEYVAGLGSSSRFSGSCLLHLVVYWSLGVVMLSSLSNIFLCWNSKYYALTSQSRQHCLESGLFLASLSFTGICFSNICFSDVWELLVHLSVRVFLSSSDEESFHKHSVLFLFRAISREAKFAEVVAWAKNTGTRDFGGVYWEDYHSGWDPTGVCQGCSLSHEWLEWQVRACGHSACRCHQAETGFRHPGRRESNSEWFLTVTTSRKPSRMRVCKVLCKGLSSVSNKSYT